MVLLLGNAPRLGPLQGLLTIISRPVLFELQEEKWRIAEDLHPMPEGIICLANSEGTLAPIRSIPHRGTAPRLSDSESEVQLLHLQGENSASVLNH